MWVWPGNTQDQNVLEEVKGDLAGWRLNRTVWVTDAGFNSADNRQLLQAGGSGFIVAEKLRGNETAVVEARGRPGRFRDIGDGLEVKQITVGQGVTAQRFIMCRNLDVARRDAATRDKLVGILADRIEGSDKLSKTKRAELRGRLIGRSVAAPRSVASERSRSRRGVSGSGRWSRLLLHSNFLPPGVSFVEATLAVNVAEIVDDLVAAASGHG